MFLAHSWSIFPIFGVKKNSTSYGFPAPRQNSEETNDTIPRKRSDRRKDGETLFHRTLPATTGGPIKDFLKISWLEKKLENTPSLAMSRNFFKDFYVLLKFLYVWLNQW